MLSESKKSAPVPTARSSSTTCSPFPPPMEKSFGPASEARVVGEVVEEGRGAKILVFHYKRKKQYKKLRGHRQAFSAVRITEIAYDGQSFKAPELPKKEPKVKKAAPAAEAKAAAPKAAGKKKAAKKTRSKKAPSKEKVTT